MESTVPLELFSERGVEYSCFAPCSMDTLRNPLLLYSLSDYLLACLKKFRNVLRQATYSIVISFSRTNLLSQSKTMAMCDTSDKLIGENPSFDC